MSGGTARPAALLAGAGSAAPISRGFAVATLAAVALHVGLFAARPGALASSYVAPAAPAMAVRMLPATVAAPAAAVSPEAAIVAPPEIVTAAIEPPRARESSPAGDARTAPPPSLPTDAATRAARPAEEGAVTTRASKEGAAATPALKEPDTADPPLPAAPDYAFGIHLDPGPRPLGEIEPEYPDSIRLREGTVVLRLLISDTGRVDNVAVVRSEPRGVFEQAALDAFSKARFSPGLAAGLPVKSQITVEVQFVPINRGARVSGRTY